MQAVLFDLDGTLVESAPDMADAIRQMLGELNLPAVTDEHVRGWIGNGRWKLVERTLRHVLNQAEGELDAALYHEANERYAHAYLNSPHERTYLYAGALDLLQYLHGKVQLGIVTNKDHAFALPLLSKLAIINLFDVVLGGDSCTERKPKPGPIIEAMAQLGSDTKHTIMVGDSNNDFDAARAANVYSVGLSHGYHRGQALRADTLFADYQQCLAWFQAQIQKA